MTFTYDNDGNLTQRADGTNTTTYGYDWANRRTSESFPSSRTNAYVYDRSSNLTSVTDPDGVVSYTYDAANRLASVTSPKPTSGTETITYDPTSTPSKVTVTYPGRGRCHGHRAQAGDDLRRGGQRPVDQDPQQLGDDAQEPHLRARHQRDRATSALVQSVTDEAGNLTTYTHGAADRLTQAKTVNGATAVEQWDYLFDAAGNRTRRTRTVGAGSPVATSYAYNTANELCWSVPGTTPGSCSCPTTTTCTATPAGGTTYSYDANGQRTTGATYDALGRLSAFGANSLGYLSPGNGELVSYGQHRVPEQHAGPQPPDPFQWQRDRHHPRRRWRADRPARRHGQQARALLRRSRVHHRDGRRRRQHPQPSLQLRPRRQPHDHRQRRHHEPPVRRRPPTQQHVPLRRSLLRPATATWTQQDPINQISSSRRPTVTPTSAGIRSTASILPVEG